MTAKRVLLVDDDADMRKVFSKRLELAGYEVVRAGDGEEALTEVTSQAPDLIILDVMLPKMNGFEVCAKLKQDPATSKIPIVMFTAKGQPEDHLAGLMFGADAYISKTCEAQELLDQVKGLIQQASV